LGLVTIFQVPSTVLVGPGVGVANGAEVWVAVGIGVTVAIGVLVFLAEAAVCAGCAPMTTIALMSVLLSSSVPIRIGNLLE
jgi:hypothetical protein